MSGEAALWLAVERFCALRDECEWNLSKERIRELERAGVELELALYALVKDA